MDWQWVVAKVARGNIQHISYIPDGTALLHPGTATYSYTSIDRVGKKSSCQNQNLSLLPSFTGLLTLRR